MYGAGAHSLAERVSVHIHANVEDVLSSIVFREVEYKPCNTVWIDMSRSKYTHFTDGFPDMELRHVAQENACQ